ncbi:MAG: UvrB/UvrC motif-containing protein [Planctomycetota bacterium]
MLCQRCGETEATVFTTSIVNDEMHKRALCEPCYEAEGLALPFSQGKIADVAPAEGIVKIDLDLLKNAFARHLGKGRESKRCPNCGMTLEQFKKRHVVGCPHDYEVFKEELGELLRRLHAGDHHRGKLPQAIEMRRIRDHRARQLREELERAIHAESYEEAARLRDRIRALEDSETTGD